MSPQAPIAETTARRLPETSIRGRRSTLHPAPTSADPPGGDRQLTDHEAACIEVTVAAPFASVWQALRDPRQIREWFGWEYDGLAEEIVAIFEDETEASKDDGTLYIGGHLFDLAEYGDETVVRVTRTQPPDGGTDWDTTYDDVEEGWLTFLQQLRFALARHPGHSRRTVHVDGVPSGSPPVPAVERLGLADAAASAVGRRYRSRTPWGDPLAGKVWFRSTNQVGLTVDQWGDGLLILFESPASVAALLTTFGLDDRQFLQLEQRWTEWWHATYRSAQVARDAS